MKNFVPPPVIDSARVLLYANVPDEMPFTGKIYLNVGGEWLGRVPNLAICRNYNNPSDILLLFCDENWKSQGCIGFASIEEAKLKAERGYVGISDIWVQDHFTEAQVAEFLRDEYDVDPSGEWWTFKCSFCLLEIEGQAISRGWATICDRCVAEFYQEFHGGDA